MTGPGTAGDRSDRSDRELVDAVLSGERSAYRYLVERHEDALFRRALSIVGDSDLAADMVQETFVRAYERLADCADPSRFGGWAYRALRNRCYDDLRAARNRGHSLSAAAPLAGGEDPDADLERSQLRGLIREALDTLSPLLREAFVLKHVDGLSYDEMQELTGVSTSALKMRVKRAREELEEALRPHVATAADVTQDSSDTSVVWMNDQAAERGQA